MVKVSEYLTLTFECTLHLHIEYLCCEKGTILKYPFEDHAETPITNQVAFVEFFCCLFKFIIRNSFMSFYQRYIFWSVFFFVFRTLTNTYAKLIKEITAHSKCWCIKRRFPFSASLDKKYWPVAFAKGPQMGISPQSLLHGKFKYLRNVRASIYWLWNFTTMIVIT